MFSMFRSPKTDVSFRPETTVALPDADLAVVRRRKALDFLTSALRSGLVQLADTDSALRSIVHNVAEADLSPVSGRSWELLARRLRATLADQLHEQLLALDDLQAGNRSVQTAIDLMGSTSQSLDDDTCRMAEATVRQHLSACTQRLTLIAQMVRQMNEVRLGLVNAAA